MELKKNFKLMSKKVFIKTFGCQMNEYDSNRIYESVSKIGYEKTERFDEANCYIINTCHIRDKAKEKVYHEIGRVKKNFKLKEKPVVIVAGCVAQAENNEMIKREPYIDIVIGPQSYHKINGSILSHIKNKEKEEQTDFDTISKFDYFDKIRNNNSKVSAFLTIQEGCDKFCHFCVVPYTRGPEYSRPFNQIIVEAEELIKNGAKEITLLGQNVNSYGRDLMIDNKRSPYFTQLLYKIHEIDGIERIRFTSPHPKDFKEETLIAVSELPKIANQIHIPLQSGSDKILSSMHRGYNQKKYLSKIDMIKNIIPDVSLSSDVIVGFPGEDDADFDETMKVVDYAEFDLIYMFKFSPRPGTVAADYSDKFVEKHLIDTRFMRLKEDQIKISQNRYKRFIGSTQQMLVEKPSKKDPNVLTGRIEGGHIVHLESTQNIIGQLIDVKVYDATPFFLKATL